MLVSLNIQDISTITINNKQPAVAVSRCDVTDDGVLIVSKPLRRQLSSGFGVKFHVNCSRTGVGVADWWSQTRDHDVTHRPVAPPCKTITTRQPNINQYVVRSDKKLKAPDSVVLHQ